MAKVKVERAWGKFEEMELLKAYGGHYEVEFTFNGEHFYLVTDYENDVKRDVRVYTEQEFLLADEPETMYEVHNSKEHGRLPNGMSIMVWEAMKLGHKKAESGTAYFKLGW